MVSFNDGFIPGVKAFTAAVLGGIGSLPGAVLGGLLIGLIEVHVVGLFHHRLQGRRRLLHPGHRADLHALRPARPARSREGLTPMTHACRNHARRPRARPDGRASRKPPSPALVTFGLCIPIIAWGTRQNMRQCPGPRSALGRGGLGRRHRLRRPLPGRRLRQQGAARPQVAGCASCRRAPPPSSSAHSRSSARSFSALGLGFLVTFPIIAINLAGWGGALKWIDNFGIQILIYVMLGWGLNIVVGLAGLLDLGYVAFYAVGAYSYALLAKNFGLSFWILLPLAGILAAFWGMLLGFPVLRLRGDYLAIVTLAFGEIIRLVLINWVDFSGGYAGISGIPRPSFFGIPVQRQSTTASPRSSGCEFSPLYRTIFLYYLILALALLTAFVTLRLRRLPVGRAWEALREDEIACRSLGINTTNTKLTAFCDRRDVRRLRRRLLRGAPGLHLAGILRLHGIGDHPRHRRARRHGLALGRAPSPRSR